MDDIKIVNGNFYFINDQYYVDFPDSQLMDNKEVINRVEHNRPSFYSLMDTKTGLYWFIPISSQVTKFQALYDKKILKYKEVDTIVFGFVLGKKKAFLIQNMFPATSEYILNEYIDSVTQNPVIIIDKLKEELKQKSIKVLGLQRKGIKLIFPDVLKIESRLLANIVAKTATKEAAPAVPENIFKKE